MLMVWGAIIFIARTRLYAGHPRCRYRSRFRIVSVACRSTGMWKAWLPESLRLDDGSAFRTLTDACDVVLPWAEKK